MPEGKEWRNKRDNRQQMPLLCSPSALQLHGCRMVPLQRRHPLIGLFLEPYLIEISSRGKLGTDHEAI